MKSFIITIGIVILSFTILVFQSEVNEVRRDISKVEEAANEVIAGSFMITNESMRSGKLLYNYDAIETGLSTLDENLPKEMEYEAHVTITDEQGTLKTEVIKTSNGIKEGGPIANEQRKIFLVLTCKYKPFSLSFLRGENVEIKIERRGELIPH